MKSGSVLASCVILAVIFPGLVHLIVPPKTPVLSGFEPAAIGSYRELVCDESQHGAGTITYKWYKYSTANGVEDWETKGPIGSNQKYVFNPVTEKKVFHNDPTNTEPVSGKYKCRASNSATTRDSEWGDLYVYKPCSLYNVSVSPAKPAIGRTFTLNCYIPNPSGFAENWYKRADASSEAIGAAIANSLGCHTPLNDPRISWSSCSPPNISSPTHTFNQRVTNAVPSDFAYWVCKDISLSCDSKPVKLVVQAPPGTPQIAGFPSGPVTAGTQLNLRCVASPTGDTYDWYKDGTKVTTSSSYDFRVTNESAGVYKCTARNDVGSATSSAKTLVVYFPNTKVSFLNNPTAAVQAGQVKKFTCETDESNPITHIKWYQYIGPSWRDNITTGISSLERNGAYGGKIRISEWSVTATKAMNGATVRCKSSYLLGKDVVHDVNNNADTTMNVKFNHSKITILQHPLTTVHEGKSFDIVCSTDSANPVADIRFLRKRTGGTWEQLTSGIASEDWAGEYKGRIRKSTLTVTAHRLDIQAVFKCEVKNGSFLVEQNVTINVYFPPTVRISSNPKPVKEGDTLTLACAASGGNPSSYTYKWFYKNKEIPNETSRDYNITSIKYTQSGTYRCQANNYSPDGKADGSMNIDIQYKAKWNPDLPEVFTVASKPNTPMKFVLHVIANPPPTNVTWLFPNMTTIGRAFAVAKVNDTTYTLNKTYVGVNDYGNYTVNVTNDVGISSFVFELEKAGRSE